MKLLSHVALTMHRYKNSVIFSYLLYSVTFYHSFYSLYFHLKVIILPVIILHIILEFAYSCCAVALPSLTALVAVELKN